MNELPDLPDSREQLAAFEAANDRMRREGTRNLLDAAATAGARRFLSQSIAWRLPGKRGAAAQRTVELLEADSGVVTITDA